MRDNGLYPVYMRKYKPKHWRKDLETRVNILNGDFKISEPNKVWSADITYIWIEKMGWSSTTSLRISCYLSSIMDLCTRKIVAWSFDATAHAENTVRVLEKAIKNEKPDIGLILHTDQGVQYTSYDFLRNRV